MDSLNSMVSKLSATGIYSLNEDSNVYSELKAYAEGLDVLVSELEVMLRECFFSTAEDYGLERAERLWGNVHNDMVQKNAGRCFWRVLPSEQGILLWKERKSL